MKIELRSTLLVLVFAAITGCAAGPATPVAVLPLAATATPIPQEEIKKLELMYVEPSEGARVIREVFKIGATYETATHNVIVWGAPEKVQAAMALLTDLDKDSCDLNDDVFFMRPLKNAKVQDLAQLLHHLEDAGLFPQGGRCDPYSRMVVDADMRTNTLIVAT